MTPSPIDEPADGVAPEPTSHVRPISAPFSVEWLLGITALVLVLVGSLIVVLPFLSSTLWAVILVYTTWPAYVWLRVDRRFSKSMAATLMVLAALIVLVVPLALLAPSMGDQIGRGLAWLRGVIAVGVPPPPGWLAELPLIGSSIAAEWQSLASGDLELGDALSPYADRLGQFALAAGLGLGGGLLEMLLSLVIMFFLYRDGEVLASRVEGGLGRLVGGRAKHLLQVAGMTVKGVVYGLIGTALVQGAIATLGFFIAGVPGALFLGFLTVLLSLLPIGPPLIWMGATAWLFAQGHTGWAIFMGLWGAIMISSSDNVIRPWLISRVGGTSTPLILVILGVLGGALAFGLLGVFLGPTLLAVAYTLIAEWTMQRRTELAERAR